MVLRGVVLPLPDCPTRPRTSPGAMSRATRSSARTAREVPAPARPPKSSVSPRTRIVPSAAGAVRRSRRMKEAPGDVVSADAGELRPRTPTGRHHDGTACRKAASRGTGASAGLAGELMEILVASFERGRGLQQAL